MALPSGYKRLEYIRSSGTQYINTGFKPTGATKIVCDFQMVNQGTNQQGVFGSRPGASGRFTVFTGNGTSDLQVDYGTEQTLATVGSSISGLNTNNRTTLEVSNSLVVNGTTIKTVSAVSFTSAYNLFLFANNNIGAVQLQSTMKLYSCQIYDNGTLIRDYIPCQKPDGTIGLLDDVNSVFYGNAGTGTFAAGPEVGVATPENFRLSSSTETTAMLAWSAVDGATGYKLYRDGILIATLTDTSYTDTIQPFTSYIYTLTAYNDSGESDPATISVQVITPPETPSNFRASSASMTAISLAWDAVAGADSYQLKRNGSVIYSGEGTSYTDSGLTAETSYTYTLSAVNTTGSSAETMLEAATTQLILVTDRTQADVTAQNAKGTYNASDLNRVGAAVRYVADLFHGLGYGFTVSPKTDWKETDWPTPSDMDRYLRDVSTLRGLLTQMETTPNVPNSMEKLTHWTANDIEQILMDLNDSITRLKAAMFYAGEIYSGEESI